jgi:hypothetical protein
MGDLVGRGRRFIRPLSFSHPPRSLIYVIPNHQIRHHAYEEPEGMQGILQVESAWTS